eukprot:scaffold309262_cov17-Tisochrysis_lutea.AAC.1
MANSWARLWNSAAITAMERCQYSLADIGHELLHSCAHDCPFLDQLTGRLYQGKSSHKPDALFFP